MVKWHFSRFLIKSAKQSALMHIPSRFGFQIGWHTAAEDIKLSAAMWPGTTLQHKSLQVIRSYPPSKSRGRHSFDANPFRNGFTLHWFSEKWQCHIFNPLSLLRDTDADCLHALQKRYRDCIENRPWFSVNKQRWFIYLSLYQMALFGFEGLFFFSSLKFLSTS